MMESDVALNQTVALNQKAEYDSKRLTWGYNALIWGTLETRRKTASSTRGHSTGRKAFPCQSSFPEIARFRSSWSFKG